MAVIASTTLPRKSLVGSNWSASVPVPLGVVAFRALSDISPSDINKANLTLKLWIERSVDGAITWKGAGGVGWNGGEPNTDITVHAGGATHVRFLLDVPLRMSVGGTVELHDTFPE